MPYCPNGHGEKPDGRFCNDCGATLLDAPPQPAPAPAPADTGAHQPGPQRSAVVSQPLSSETPAWRAGVFCPQCGEYFPAGAVCPDCGSSRSPIQRPAAPDRPFWQAQVQGSVAAQMGLAETREGTVLVVPWGHLPRRGDGRAADGGVSVVRLSDGQELWRRSLGMPVEGGAAVSDDLIVVGMGIRSIGAGDGWLVALSTETGEDRWRQRLSGTVRCAPAMDGVRVYATVNGGSLCCLDARTGQVLWQSPAFEAATAMPSSPLIVKERGVVQCIIVGTYSGAHEIEEGRVVAFDERGRKLWARPAGGSVRGTPTVEDGTLYVTAFRSMPSAGVLSALDARTGQPRWAKPFAIQGQATDAAQHGFSASPLVVGDTVYVGCLNHTLYGVDAATGELKSEVALGGGIATGPAHVRGLIVCGANDNRIHAVRGGTGEIAWAYAFPDRLLTTPVILHDEIVLAGCADGSVAALPWHLGRYEWAATALELAQHAAEAGDCRALAAHFSQERGHENPNYRRAADDWCAAGEPDKAARMWRKFNQDEMAARSLSNAGHFWQLHEPERACGCFQEAATLYYQLRLADDLNDCTRSLAGCAGLPYIDIKQVVAGTVVQWQPGKATIRLQNLGEEDAPGPIRLWFGGQIQQEVNAQIAATLTKGEMWNIPITVVATQPKNRVDVEVTYGSGDRAYASLHGMYSFNLEAVPPPQDIIIGDVGLLKLEISSQTAEGLRIVTQDIGALHASAGIGSVQAQGDIGNVGVDGGIGSIQADGGIGVVRGT